MASYQHVHTSSNYSYLIYMDGWSLNEMEEEPLLCRLMRAERTKIMYHIQESM